MRLQLSIYWFTHVTIAWLRSHFRGLVITILFRLGPKIFPHSKLILSGTSHCWCNLSRNQGRKLNWCGKNGYSKSQMQLLLYLLWYSAKQFTDCMRNGSHQVLPLSPQVDDNQVISFKNMDTVASFPISVIAQLERLCQGHMPVSFFFFLLMVGKNTLDLSSVNFKIYWMVCWL